MRSQRSPSALRWFSVLFIVGSIVLTTIHLVRFSRLRAHYPAGLKVAGVSVGGLDRQQTAQRLLAVYSSPVIMHYQDQVIHLDPGTAGFQLNLDGILAVADLRRTQGSFWLGFWDYLWNRTQPSQVVPLHYTYSEQQLRDYLQAEIAARYDTPPVPAVPFPGTSNFIPGTAGSRLDIQRSLPLIATALMSSTDRSVVLPLSQVSPPRPSFSNLQIMLQQIIEVANYDGLIGVYLQDLQTGEEIQFAYQRGNYLSTNPDVAFTAASIIKIAVMVSVMRRIPNPPPPAIDLLMLDMISKSSNEETDELIKTVIDKDRGPLDVTKDIQTLGFENTFLAGLFYPGAPLLWRYTTPANGRTDVNSDPDPYNQTTASDIGKLLSDIYICAQSGGGSLVAAFGDELTTAKCRLMIDYLTRNRIGLLLESGLPDGTQIAHKHGWVTDLFGVINTISDAGIVYTPGGDYVFTIFMYHPEQLVWEPSSELVRTLSTAAYNYYNQYR